LAPIAGHAIGGDLLALAGGLAFAVAISTLLEPVFAGLLAAFFFRRKIIHSSNDWFGDRARLDRHHAKVAKFASAKQKPID
jgi:hypothetical protein